MHVCRRKTIFIYNYKPEKSAEVQTIPEAKREERE